MGQRYAIHFTDRRGREVAIEIDNEDWDGEAEELTAGASPLVLQEDDTEGIDTPSRAWTGSLTVVADGEADLSGLFAADVKSAPVRVYVGGELAWQGYIVPDVMKQSWVEGDEVTVSVQSPLAALDGLTLELGSLFSLTTIGGILSEALSLAGDWDHVAYPDDISVPALGEGTDGWMDVQVSRRAFFDREEEEEEESERTTSSYEGMTGLDCVEAVARLLGWTARERGRTLWLTAESVAGYKRVAVPELADSGRAVEDVAADGMDIDELDSAGTDHTQSQLQGYRRVRVEFAPDTVDDLLADAVDSANWKPLEQYEFEEDYELQYKDKDENLKDAGWHVTPAAGGAGVTIGLGYAAARYVMAVYAAAAADGSSRTRLYRTDGWDHTVSSVEEITGDEELRDTSREKVWAEETGDGTYSSTVGARRAVFQHRNATFGVTDWNEWLAQDFQDLERDSGFLIWACHNRQFPIHETAAGLDGLPVVELHHISPLLSGVALRLDLSIGGFLGMSVPSTSASTGEFNYNEGMGPHTVAGPSGMTVTENEDAAWPFYLRVGDKVWTGENWADAALYPDTHPSFLLPLQGSERTDEWATPADIDDVSLLEQYGLDEGYVIPLTDGTDDIPVLGEVEFIVFLPYVKQHEWMTGVNANLYNPFFIKDISLSVITKDIDLFDYDSSSGDTKYYVAETGMASSEGMYSVEVGIGSYDVGMAYNILYVGKSVLASFASKRQGGREALPERLLVDTLCRLYGRSRRQLSLEVDAARLSPGVVLTDTVEGRTYALTGVSWDVREDKCTYTMEDYIPYTEWNG